MHACYHYHVRYADATTCMPQGSRTRTYASDWVEMWMHSAHSHTRPQPHSSRCASSVLRTLQAVCACARARAHVPARMRALCSSPPNLYSSFLTHSPAGTLYISHTDHVQMLDEAYTLFSVTNPLHCDAYPSVRGKHRECTLRVQYIYNIYRIYIYIMCVRVAERAHSLTHPHAL